MFKKVFILFTFIFMFSFIDVKADSEYTCVYKNGNDTIKLTTKKNDDSSHYGGGIQWQVIWKISYNDADPKIVFPITSIVKDQDGNYRYNFDGYYYDENANIITATLGCPNFLEVGFNNDELATINNIIVKTSVTSENVDTNYETLVVNFSTYASSFDTENMLILLKPDKDELVANELETIYHNDYANFKTFTYVSKNENIDNSSDITSYPSYCYYKNKCEKVIELIREKDSFKIDDEKVNVDMLTENSCPDYINFTNNNYFLGACTETTYQCYKKTYELSERDESLIVEGENCPAVLGDNSIRYLNLKGADYISISYGNNNLDAISSQYFNGSYLTSINISNEEDSNITSLFSTKSPDKYPTYIISENGNYKFSNEKSSTGKNFILTNKLYELGIGANELEKTCKAIFGNTFLSFLQENVFKIIYIIVPIILIVLTSYDFAKVVFSDDKEGMPNAWKRFTKRAIAAVLVFFVPSILSLIINIIGVDEVSECVNWAKEHANEMTTE